MDGHVGERGTGEGSCSTSGKIPLGMENAVNLWRLKHGFVSRRIFKGRED